MRKRIALLKHFVRNFSATRLGFCLSQMLSERALAAASRF